MKRRNETLIYLTAFILTAVLAVLFAYILWFDDSDGLGLMDSSVSERASRHYIFKTAADPGILPNAVVSPGKRYRNSAANIVTAVVTDYRVLDTLGEVIVLFISAAGVSLLISGRKRRIAHDAGVIVGTAVPLIMLFAVIVGAYIVLHGHLGPGGGFSGGAVLASAFILQFLAKSGPARRRALTYTEAAAGLALLAVGTAGLIFEGSFFGNFLPQGELGNLLSSGISLLVYLIIGIKVAAELSALAGDFIGGE
jgi:multicomponent Na+:H+ antiporter subunit B